MTPILCILESIRSAQRVALTLVQLEIASRAYMFATTVLASLWDPLSSGLCSAVSALLRLARAERTKVASACDRHWKISTIAYSRTRLSSLRHLEHRAVCFNRNCELIITITALPCSVGLALPTNEANALVHIATKRDGESNATSV
jgi:hypothetical protein